MFLFFIFPLLQVVSFLTCYMTTVLQGVSFSHSFFYFNESFLHVFFSLFLYYRLFHFSHDYCTTGCLMFILISILHFPFFMNHLYMFLYSFFLYYRLFHFSNAAWLLCYRVSHFFTHFHFTFPFFMNHLYMFFSLFLHYRLFHFWNATRLLCYRVFHFHTHFHFTFPFFMNHMYMFFFFFHYSFTTGCFISHMHMLHDYCATGCLIFARSVSLKNILSFLHLLRLFQYRVFHLMYHKKLKRVMWYRFTFQYLEFEFIHIVNKLWTTL